MVMTISNYEGTADQFSFPHNPQTFDDIIDGNQTFINLPYYRHHIVTGGGGINPKSIVLVGHFDGATKLTSYRSLAKHVSENHKLKKLYWESNKFYLCVGRQIKQTNTGGRTNFIDYVCSFETIIGILFGNTQKTTGTNAGNVNTFIESITGQYDGSGDMVISDNLGNSVTIPEASFSGKPYFKFYFVKMVDAGGGIYVSEYNYFEVCATVGGTYTQIKTIKTTAGSGMLQLASGANVSTITITNYTGTPVVTFRDGWIA